MYWANEYNQQLPNVGLTIVRSAGPVPSPLRERGREGEREREGGRKKDRDGERHTFSQDSCPLTAIARVTAGFK